MSNTDTEVLRRFGMESESAQRLSGQARIAKKVLGIHGVSVTARTSTAPARTRLRSDVELEFPVHDTPSHRDTLHRTIELPDPVTEDIAMKFNELFRYEVGS